MSTKLSDVKLTIFDEFLGVLKLVKFVNADLLDPQSCSNVRSTMHGSDGGGN